jgi:hypothetical protein
VFKLRTQLIRNGLVKLVGAGLINAAIAGAADDEVPG